MIVENSKNFEAGYGITFQNHRRLLNAATSILKALPKGARPFSPINQI
jgi:hypothetical protein